MPSRLPDPCVPVAIAPATEMWGSDARLCNATPLAWSTGASSPYVIAGLRAIVPDARSMSTVRGS